MARNVQAAAQASPKRGPGRRRPGASSGKRKDPIFTISAEKMNSNLGVAVANIRLAGANATAGDTRMDSGSFAATNVVGATVSVSKHIP